MKTIRVAMLNVVMPPPHSKERYVELFKLALRMRRAVDLRGDFKGMIGAVNDEGAVVTGQLYKFFDLDPDSPWFDISKRQQAEEDDIAKINIPENLKPHHQSFDFILFAKQHRIAYVARDGAETLSPQMAKKLLDRVFESDRVLERFGQIDVTVEPQREQLQRILSLPRLKKLRIEVTPPNPDDLEEAERDVFERMANERAQRMTIELGSKHPQGLAPDEDHKTLARVAQSNGKVVGAGENAEGRMVDLSTADRPMVEPVTYDPQIELRSAALGRKGQELLERVREG